MNIKDQPLGFKAQPLATDNESFDQHAEQHLSDEQRRTHTLLTLLLTIYDQKNLARLLNESGIQCNRESINKWKKDPVSNPITFNMAEQTAIRSALLPAKPAHYDNPAFTFIDLFAGIGGIRKGFDAIGGKCLFTCEWDDYARRTYLANHYVAESEQDYFTQPADSGEAKNQSFMNIQNITLSQQSDATEEQVIASIQQHIPDHEVLLAGFPCQPFSLAGVSKKNALGRAHGFDCDTQGTLFFDIEKILDVKKPPFFVLENVKNLKSHDKGNTFEVIVKTLDRLGYWLADISDEDSSIDAALKKVKGRRPEPIIIDAKHFLPQHRERVVLIGVRKDVYQSQQHQHASRLSLRNIHQHMPETRPTLKMMLDDNVADKYTLTENLWKYLFNYALKHKAKGNGFGYGLVDPNNTQAVTRTLSARYFKDGSEILINHQGLTASEMSAFNATPEQFKPGYKTPRRLTPPECARLMGFATKETVFHQPVSDTRAYKQFGNSVVVPVFASVAKLLEPWILHHQGKES